MDCQEVKTMLSDYLANSLKSNYNEEIKEHLAKCQNCADSFKKLVETDNIIKLTANEEPSEQYWNNYLPKFKTKLDRVSTLRLSNPFRIFVPKLSFAFNGVLIISLIIISAFFYKNTQQMKSLRYALNQQKEEISSQTTPGIISPIIVSKQDIEKTTAKNVKLFSEMEDMFPNTIQWVVTSDEQIELGLSRNTMAEKIVMKDIKPIFLKFNILKLSETPEIVSSANMMVLNGNEVNTKMWGLSKKDYTPYRYHCLPILRTDGKIDLRVRISLDGASLETDITAKEGDKIELGRIRKDNAEYSIYVNVISKGVDIVKTEDTGI